jgi:hypothetical protein
MVSQLITMFDFVVLIVKCVYVFESIAYLFQEFNFINSFQRKSTWCVGRILLLK